jgi:hypothetical protein
MFDDSQLNVSRNTDLAEAFTYGLAHKRRDTD